MLKQKIEPDDDSKKVITLTGALFLEEP